MGAVTQIKNFDDILQKYVGKQLTFAEVKELPLNETQEGLIRVDVTCEDRHKKSKELLYTVAKLAPKDEEKYEAIRKELAFYTVVVPKLQSFQKQNGVKDVLECFPEFYGGRLNLNGNKETDENAVILIENLIESGFKSTDPLIGYNLEETQVILKELASFHAIFLAMRLRKPMEFGRRVLDNCAIYKNRNPKMPSADILLQMLYENNTCLPYISKIRSKINTPPKSEIREPWATVCHGNLWTVNVMVKHDKDNRPIECKFLDFTNYKYDSPTVELLKFLLSSVELHVLEVFLDSLLQTYHDSFVHTIKNLGIDSEDFNWIQFQQELKAASSETILARLFFLIYVVYGKEGEHFLSTRDVPLKAKEKVWFIVQEWGRRNWL